jgi:hypothetical protein
MYVQMLVKCVFAEEWFMIIQQICVKGNVVGWDQNLQYWLHYRVADWHVINILFLSWAQVVVPPTKSVTLTDGWTAFHASKGMMRYSLNFMNFGVHYSIPSRSPSLTVVFTFYVLFHWSGMRPHGWWFYFSHSPAVVQITLSLSKPCLSLFEVDHICALWIEIIL